MAATYPVKVVNGLIDYYYYYAAMNLAPNMRPPVCLRYAMWVLAGSVTDKYAFVANQFYQQARKYAQQDEMRHRGENIVKVTHSQTWSLISNYEPKNMYFPRAWRSVGRASKLAQMLCLHRLDEPGLDVQACLPEPPDWVEKEERRRALWASFCGDRYASIGKDGL